MKAKDHPFGLEVRLRGCSFKRSASDLMYRPGSSWSKTAKLCVRDASDDESAIDNPVEHKEEHIAAVPGQPASSKCYLECVDRAVSHPPFSPCLG